MDQIENRELPGNDASWYEALLAEQAATPAVDDVQIAASAPEAVATAAAVKDLPEATSEPLSDKPASGEAATDIAGDEESNDDAAVADDADTADADTAESDTAGAATPDTETADDDGADAAITDDATPDTEMADDIAGTDTVDAEAGVTDETPVVAAVAPVSDDDSPLENTSEMVGQLWTARDSFGPLEDWEPDEMDRKISSTRSFRWPTLIGVIAVIGLIVVGLVLLPSITRSRADDHLEMITTALRDLRAELPETQGSLATATDPASQPADLSGLTTQLTELAAKASNLDKATQAELPKAPPLTSSAPIDEIEPIRQSAEPLGTVALTIQQRISNVAEYRTLMDGFLSLPELPTTADAATQAELRVELASAQADSAAILADLPSDVALEEHQAMAREINEEFATWQVDYLEALRTGDAALAGELISELEADLAELEAALVTPLAQIRRQTDTDLIDLARDIDEVVALADSTGAAG